MNWCKHIKKTDGLWSFDFSGGDVRNVNKWDADCYGFKFCPVCGTPKPERKGLAEKLRIAWLNHDFSGSSLSVFEQASKVAIDHACEVIDEWSKNYASDMNDSLTLKKMLRESI